jgi:putative transposase
MQKDHEHLLIQVWADKPVSTVVQILKGGTSKKLREEFPEIEEFLCGDSFWADGYFAKTVGIADEEMIRRYIREQ